jgi:colanic acid/amylovoran biosynthesis glycosyltransferase
MSDGLHLVEVGLDWPPETFLQWKFEELAARGVAVTVASAVPRSAARKQVRGARLERLPPWDEPRLAKLLGAACDALRLLVTRPGRLWRLVAEVRRPWPVPRANVPPPSAVSQLRLFLRLARLAPDVVQFEWASAAVNHLPLLEVWRCPMVITCHGEVGVLARSRRDATWFPGLPAAFAAADAVHCVSEATRDQAVSFGLDPSKARVIRPAVDPDFFHPGAAGDNASGELRVLGVGNLTWVKGHEYAFHAVRLLVERGVPVRYDLVGEVRPDLGDAAAERDRILGAIDDLELRDRVRLHGRLPSSAVRDRIQEADILLQPSVTEGIPTTVLEAMACGLPVVVTDCGGVREAVTDAEAGLVVPPRDPEAIAAALEALWRDPELRERMGRAGRARVESRFALRDQVESFLALYRELIDARGRSDATRPRRPAARLHLLEVGLRWPPETFLQRKLEALAARGVRVTVASPVSRRGSGPRLPGVELRRVPHWLGTRPRKLLELVVDGARLLFSDPARLIRLIEAVRARPSGPAGRRGLETLDLLRMCLRLARLRPDVAHFEWETAAARYLPLMDVWDCPVVVSCRGREIHVYPHTPGNEDWVGQLPSVFRKAAAVHCVSEAIRAEATRYGLDPAKAWLIRPAVDTAFFHPGGDRTADPALRVIGVGDLFWVKGQEYALKAIRLLADRGIPARFEIVGGVRPDLGDAARERERLLRTIEDLELGDRVTLHGPLGPAEVRSRLQRADALLHASLAEGIPNTVLEAMACGLPVVATDCGGTREAVSDGREGFVVAPRDSEAMAAALERLWREPELGREMGRAGRARVESEFALAQQVPRIAALYEHVTSPRDALAR